MEIQENVVLADFTTFHIGGTADYFCKAESIADIIAGVEFAKEKNLPFFILGQGANILVGDKGYRGLVIKNETSKIELSSKNYELRAESGATIQQLINFCLSQGLSGFEHFAGIPSSVGGALWQNLHFLNPERTETVFIGDIVQEASLLEFKSHPPAGGAKLKTVTRDYFKFNYDYSSLHDSHDVILTATFQLTKKPKEEIQKVVDANIKWRKEKHPKNAENSSAGSVFKKIEHHGAGRLIEQVGLKGYKIGGAQISETHANFILNTGGAKATDVIQLIALIEQKIKDQLGLEMIPEISFVGEF